LAEDVYAALEKAFLQMELMATTNAADKRVGKV
jgi:hypothetical protein